MRAPVVVWVMMLPSSRTPEGLQTLVTTDLLLEGIHFDLTYTPLRHLGYKAAVGSFSDIYAMNGHPQQLTCSVGVSARFAVEDLEELYAGIRLACSRYGVDLVGGDTSASLTGLCISITCLGAAREEEIVYRTWVLSPPTFICVSGKSRLPPIWGSSFWSVRSASSQGRRGTSSLTLPSMNTSSSVSFVPKPAKISSLLFERRTASHVDDR